MNTPENGDGPGASGAAVQASLSTRRVRRNERA
jgi:hypothetical protein